MQWGPHIAMQHGTAALPLASAANCVTKACARSHPRPGLGCTQGAVENALASLEVRRSTDFTGQMLWQQQFRATEFMSRWIELKERARAAAQE